MKCPNKLAVLAAGALLSGVASADVTTTLTLMDHTFSYDATQHACHLNLLMPNGNVQIGPGTTKNPPSYTLGDPTSFNRVVPNVPNLNDCQQLAKTGNFAGKFTTTNPNPTPAMTVSNSWAAYNAETHETMKGDLYGGIQYSDGHLTISSGGAGNPYSMDHYCISANGGTPARANQNGFSAEVAPNGNTLAVSLMNYDKTKGCIAP